MNERAQLIAEINVKIEDRGPGHSDRLLFERIRTALAADHAPTREPTEAMMRAAFDVESGDPDDIWRAMWDAVPPADGDDWRKRLGCTCTVPEGHGHATFCAISVAAPSADGGTGQQPGAEEVARAVAYLRNVGQSYHADLLESLQAEVGRLRKALELIANLDRRWSNAPDIAQDALTQLIAHAAAGQGKP
jgi:hypothetical protein